MITEEDFCSATTDHVLVDKYKREWKIIKVVEGGPFPSLIVQCPKHREEKVSFCGNLGVIDEEIATIVELNCPKAHIEKKQ